MIETHLTVRELAVRYPQTLPVFEQYGIDYCCGGAEQLAHAAQQRGIELGLLLEELERAIAQSFAEGPQVEPDWREATLAALADHIERTHHTAMRALLPEVSATFVTVVRVHALRHGEMLGPLARIFDGLAREVEAHLIKEEHHLFPLIRQCEGRCWSGGAAMSWEAELREQIALATAEHEAVGAALREIRARTNGFTLPEDACPTFMRLYGGLETIERDLHRHVHLENNLLYPRAVELTYCHELR